MADRKGHLKANIERDIRDIVSFELRNPRIGFVSINQIDVSGDYSIAKVYVSFMGAKYPTQNFKELDALKGVVRSKLASRLHTRKVPEVRFVLDWRFQEAERLQKALDKEEEDLERFHKENNEE